MQISTDCVKVTNEKLHRIRFLSYDSWHLPEETWKHELEYNRGQSLSYVLSTCKQNYRLYDEKFKPSSYCNTLHYRHIDSHTGNFKNGLKMQKEGGIKRAFITNR